MHEKPYTLDEVLRETIEIQLFERYYNPAEPERMIASWLLTMVGLAMLVLTDLDSTASALLVGSHAGQWWLSYTEAKKRSLLRYRLKRAIQRYQP